MRAADWRRALLWGALAFVLSRLFVLVGAGVASSAEDPRPANAARLMTEVLTSWDGRWYLDVVRNGYPSFVPPGITYFQPEARGAFFPAYPLAVRGIDQILPGGDTLAALLLNAVLGALFVYLVGVLARRLYDEHVALRAMVLTCLFPGSFVLSFAYSEALLLCAAAGCLLLLLEQRWLLAGLLGIVATAARPNGLAVFIACAVAAILAVVHDRQWRALVAPLLAPIGFIAFQLYLGNRADEPGVWFRIQREAWEERYSFGLAALRDIRDSFTQPLSSPRDILTAVTVVAMLVGVYAAWKARLHLVPAAYTAVVIALMMLPSTVTARPRFLFTAFPLMIAVAAWWRRDEHEGWAMLLAVCGAGLVGVVGLFGLVAAIP